MTKIYINRQEVKQSNRKDVLITMLLELLVGAVTLILASNIFECFYVENIIYAFLAALLISVLDVAVKPLLILLTLPVTIMSLGLLYPVVNVIILKLTSVLMGNSFNVKGWIIPFFVAIFISIVTETMNKLIVEGR